MNLTRNPFRNRSPRFMRLARLAVDKGLMLYPAWGIGYELTDNKIGGFRKVCRRLSEVEAYLKGESQ